MRVGLMVPCYVDMFYPQVGVATLELLEKLEIGSKAQAKVDVIECNSEVGFVETAELFVKLLSYEHARARYRREILRQVGTSEVAMFVADPGVHMARNSARADNYTAVLHRPIGIPKSRSHRPNFGARSVTYHFGKPAAIFHFEIVVEQRDEGSARMPDADVVQATEIECALDSVDFYARGLA